MADKISNIYVCSACDAQSPKWTGRCLSCGKWGTLQMQTIGRQERTENIDIALPRIVGLSDLESKPLQRFKTGIAEADRVLGGGIMPGSLILLSGDPGIGKSTLVAQISDKLSKESEILYVSGEESLHQIKDRFDRLQINSQKIKFMNETLVERVVLAIKKIAPRLVIIDSIQTLYSGDIDSEPGNLAQIRASASKLTEVAKEQEVSIIIIGHITKDGTLAGPKSLEHLVDTVIYLEADSKNDFRILRAAKNRFGSVNELGIFTMTDKGFQEVSNPSAVFLETREGLLAGSAISCMVEGTRPFLVEIQALATKTAFGYPQRKSSGLDLNRLIVLAAVLNKKAGINLGSQDIIINLAGGLKVSDPALDLAVCVSIISSLLNVPVGKDLIILGEVGLGGEVRNIKHLDQRMNEAAKLGFKKALIPDSQTKHKEMEITKIKTINQIIEKLFKEK